MVIQLRDRQVQPNEVPERKRDSPCSAAASRFHCGRTLASSLLSPVVHPLPQSDHYITSGALAKPVSVRSVWTSVQACSIVGWSHTSLRTTTLLLCFTQAMASVADLARSI
ncbi:hypothetical protein M3J09_002915 [Ascochyta lentis]